MFSESHILDLMVVMKSYVGDLGGETECVGICSIQEVSAAGEGGNYAAKYASRQARERRAARCHTKTNINRSTNKYKYKYKQIQIQKLK